MDKLEIHGLDIWLHVGCTPEERAFPQKIELDVVMEMSLAAAGRRDRIEDAVDYAAVVEILKQKLSPRRYRLLEAVAEAAAELVLGEKAVQAVRLKARKRALPGIDHASVEIHRVRESGGGK